MFATNQCSDLDVIDSIGFVFVQPSSLDAILVKPALTPNACEDMEP